MWQVDLPLGLHRVIGEGESEHVRHAEHGKAYNEVNSDDSEGLVDREDAAIVEDHRGLGKTYGYNVDHVADVEYLVLEVSAMEDLDVVNTKQPAYAPGLVTQRVLLLSAADSVEGLCMLRSGSPYGQPLSPQ